MDFSTFNGASQALSYSIFFMVGAMAAAVFIHALSNVLTR